MGELQMDVKKRQIAIMEMHLLHNQMHTHQMNGMKPQRNLKHTLRLVISNSLTSLRLRFLPLNSLKEAPTQVNSFRDKRNPVIERGGWDLNDKAWFFTATP